MHRNKARTSIPNKRNNEPKRPPKVLQGLQNSACLQKQDAFDPRVKMKTMETLYLTPLVYKMRVRFDDYKTFPALIH